MGDCLGGGREYPVLPFCGDAKIAVYGIGVCPAIRQGDRSRQPFNASVAHAVVLSVWQRLHAFGTFMASLSAGVMNLKVWARTLTSAIVCSILGMWQVTHSLPALPGA
jgi:hypothetical protein